MRSVCFLLLLASATPLCAGEFSPLSPPLEVRPFALTERGGKTVGRDDLRGKVWIAHFFYPTCQGPCTKTVPTMRKLQDAFAGKPDIVLVSIALTGDDPALLRRRNGCS
jgi:protein SCO1/2